MHKLERFKKRYLFIIGNLVLLLLISCMHSEISPELDISVKPKLTEEAPSIASMIQTLNRAVEKSTETESMLRDVKEILSARLMEQNGDYLKATESWFKAISLASGPFGEIAFKGWLKSYAKNLGKKADLKVMSKLILAETKNGQVSSYMLSKNIVSEPTVEKAILENIPEWIEESREKNIAIEKDKKNLSPTKLGIPKEDPFLLLTAERYVKANIKGKDWDLWIDSLPKDTKDYWSGLVFHFSGKNDDALKALEKSFSIMKDDDQLVNLTWSAAHKMVEICRKIGQRRGSAEAYLLLMNAWEFSKLNIDQVSFSEEEYFINRIDDSIWAARFRSLIGDYENGKIFAYKALDLIAKAESNATKIDSKTFRIKIGELKAEAYNVLASRISIEKKEYDQAIALNMKALQVENVSREMKVRLQWNNGFYSFLGANYESAKRHWEDLLNELKGNEPFDHAMKAKLYFWLARNYNSLNQIQVRDFYLEKLLDTYPYNFYSVVGVKEAGLKVANDEENWESILSNIDDLEDRVENTEFDIQAISENRERMRLIKRAEVLVNAKITELSQVAVDELQKEMERNISLTKNIDAFVFLSRLQFGAQNYFKCISLTSLMSWNVDAFWNKYPEQVMLYFPEPFSDIYMRQAVETGLDKPLLLAISRQESSFRLNVKSSANAVGLMQLIYPTAQKISDDFEMKLYRLNEESLENPEMNIALGSRYLKQLLLRYKGFKPAIYGAYNAGEYAVDSWLLRRKHDDVLSWIEMVPFDETKEYIKNVWRNEIIYEKLEKERHKSKTKMRTGMLRNRNI